MTARLRMPPDQFCPQPSSMRMHKLHQLSCRTNRYESTLHKKAAVLQHSSVHPAPQDGSFMSARALLHILQQLLYCKHNALGRGR